MSKAVLISIRPEWCEKIASGEKIIEVRKTTPKLKPPFRCYIYCTKGANNHLEWSQGKVIGEFICDRIDKYWLNSSECRALSQKSCVPANELHIYAQPNEWLLGWHISDLRIYDTVKELRKFIPACRFSADGECLAGMDIGCGCKRYDCNPDLSLNAVFCDRRMYRPPQGWCYVEEL